jgi:hypothetical protein
MDDGSEKPPEAPELKSIDGGKSRASVRPHKHRRVDRDLYDRMAEAYLHGNRSVKALAREVGVSEPTAHKAIYQGWPANDWSPLKARAALYDKLHTEGREKVSPERARIARDWLKMKDDYIEIAAGLRVGIARCVAKAIKASEDAIAGRIQAVRQVHMEEVIDEAGRVTRRIPRTLTVDVNQPPDLHAVVASLSQLAAALERTGGGELEQLLAKPPADALGRGGKHKFTPEQIRYMAENQGKLPPGVTLDDFGEG